MTDIETVSKDTTPISRDEDVALEGIFEDGAEGAEDGEADDSAEETTDAQKTEAETKVEEKKAEPTPAKETKKETEEDDPKSWTIEAVKDERQKRQALEKELKELKESKSEKKEEVQAPDIFEDPEGYAKHTKELVDFQIFKTKVELTSEAMKEKHTDYDAKILVFTELAKADPTLSINLRQAANPAKFAYETVIKHEKQKELSDPDYEKKLKDKIKAEILAEMKLEEGEDPKESDKKAKESDVEIPDLINATAAKSKSNKPQLTDIDELFPA